MYEGQITTVERFRVWERTKEGCGRNVCHQKCFCWFISNKLGDTCLQSGGSLKASHFAFWPFAMEILPSSTRLKPHFRVWLLPPTRHRRSQIFHSRILDPSYSDIFIFSDFEINLSHIGELGLYEVNRWHVKGLQFTRHLSLHLIDKN